MAALLIGYARCSTDQQDLTAQHDGLTALGVSPARIYVDHGLTGTTRDRPGLREAMAACREGDTLVVTKLDRLARSLPDARAIADELTARQVRLSLGASVYDPNDPVGRLLFNVLAMVAEFESDLIRLRTRGRDEGREGQGPAARQATQAQPATGSPSGRPAPGTVTLIGMCSGAVGFGAAAMDQLWGVDISGGSVERGNLTPDREAIGHHLSVVGRRQQVPTDPEMWRNAAERRQEPLGMPG